MGEEDVGNSTAGEEIIELNLKGKGQVEYPAEGLHGGQKRATEPVSDLEGGVNGSAVSGFGSSTARARFRISVTETGSQDWRSIWVEYCKIFL